MRASATWAGAWTGRRVIRRQFGQDGGQQLHIDCMVGVWRNLHADGSLGGRWAKKHGVYMQIAMSPAHRRASRTAGQGSVFTKAK